jgi:D-alanine-D-alanine ligase
VPETRVLLLSSREPDDVVDEPPLEQGLAAGHADARADSVVHAVKQAMAALADAPSVRVSHRSVLRPSEILAAIGDHRPDVIFNFCEGLGGDSRLEVTAAWLLERLKLPFTGSPFFALRHCLYKVEANHILARAGVRVPATLRVDSPDHIPGVIFPVIVKPEREDGSMGIDRMSVVHDRRRLREQVAEVIEVYKQPAVVQRYINGREIAISLLGWPSPRVLPLGEIAFGDLPEGHPRILTFDAKWKTDTVECTETASVAAVLRPLDVRRVAAIGRRAFEVLGLRDYGRVDVRLDERGNPFVIDVNPNCDLSADGGFSRAAARTGIGYGELLWEILRCALRRSDRASDMLGSRGRSRRTLAASRGALGQSSLANDSAASTL